MARDDWVAPVTAPAAEYLARTELERFDLRPYLPQLRKRWVSPHTKKMLMRRYPLFPRYLLLPIGDLSFSAIRLCRGLRRLKPILADADGRSWRAPAEVIGAVKEAEARGDFDEILTPGNKVEVTKGALAGIKAVLTSNAGCGQVEILMPLFGGVRATVPQGNVARA
jgi:hypothetical protein